MMPSTSSRFTIVRVVLPTGERLPALVHADTWLPCRVALRWAVRYRRWKVQASTLAANLRVLSWVYAWARERPEVGDLDDFIVRGDLLDTRQLVALGETLRLGGAAWTLGAGFPAPATADQHLAVAEGFLAWAVDPANRGGAGLQAYVDVRAEWERIGRVFAALRVGGHGGGRQEPLTEEEVARIRTALGLRRDGETGLWELPLEGGRPRPPRGVFQQRTWLRNVAMLELALDVGLRRGEILKVQVSSLPRGRERELRVERLPDDPRDSRRNEPAVKTAARLLPLSRGVIRLLGLYLDAEAPVGRPRRSGTPYLFVTSRGAPLSLTQADVLMHEIGERAGVPLSWHRLRHTWAERTAERMLDDPQGWQKLKYLGGWADDRTVQVYIGHALARKAREHLAAYQGALYPGAEESA